MTNEITIRPYVPADAERVGKLTHAMECELWHDKAGSLDERRFTNAARDLLHTDLGLWALVACLSNGQNLSL